MRASVCMARRHVAAARKHSAGKDEHCTMVCFHHTAQRLPCYHITSRPVQLDGRDPEPLTWNIYRHRHVQPESLPWHDNQHSIDCSGGGWVGGVVRVEDYTYLQQLRVPFCCSTGQVWIVTRAQHRCWHAASCSTRTTFFSFAFSSFFPLIFFPCDIFAAVLSCYVSSQR